VAGIQSLEIDYQVKEHPLNQSGPEFVEWDSLGLAY
jgi:hypothetical protein